MTEKFGTGTTGMGPLAGMLDSMQFVKQAWSTFNLPTNLAPTMDVEEMDRRIADLKVVEQWLTMNLGMLRSSIQGMEMQRDTIAAMRAFGDAMTSPGEGGDAAARTIAAFGAMQRAATAAAGAAVTSMPGQAEEPAQDRTAAPEPPPGSAPPEAAAAAPAQGETGAPQQSRGPADSIVEGLSRAAAGPAAWWNLLQGQFNQVAQAAMAGAGATVRGGSERAAGGARARKGRSGPAAGPGESGNAGRKTSNGGAAKTAGKSAGKRAAKIARKSAGKDAAGAGRGTTAARAKAPPRGAKTKT